MPILSIKQELPFTDIPEIPPPPMVRKKSKLWAYMVDISRWKCSPVCFLSVYLPDYSFLDPGIGALLPTRSVNTQRIIRQIKPQGNANNDIILFAVLFY